jgi:hypothetical protein
MDSAHDLVFFCFLGVIFHWTMVVSGRVTAEDSSANLLQEVNHLHFWGIFQHRTVFLVFFPRDICFNQFSFSLAVQPLAMILGSLHWYLVWGTPHTMVTVECINPEKWMDEVEHWWILWVDWCQQCLFGKNIKRPGPAYHVIHHSLPSGLLLVECCRGVFAK